MSANCGQRYKVHDWTADSASNINFVMINKGQSFYMAIILRKYIQYLMATSGSERF